MEGASGKPGWPSGGAAGPSAPWHFSSTLAVLRPSGAAFRASRRGHRRTHSSAHPAPHPGGFGAGGTFARCPHPPGSEGCGEASAAPAGRQLCGRGHSPLCAAGFGIKETIEGAWRRGERSRWVLTCRDWPWRHEPCPAAGWLDAFRARDGAGHGTALAAGAWAAVAVLGGAAELPERVFWWVTRFLAAAVAFGFPWPGDDGCKGQGRDIGFLLGKRSALKV